MSIHRIKEEQEFPSRVFSVSNDFASQTLISKVTDNFPLSNKSDKLICN